jgi:hypothetical protein
MRARTARTVLLAFTIRRMVWIRAERQLRPYPVEIFDRMFWIEVGRRLVSERCCARGRALRGLGSVR